MKPGLLLKIAAFAQATFLIGHSIGHFTRHDTTDPGAQAALKAMAENKFEMMGTPGSYEKYYTGMSLNLSITVLAIIILLWQLSILASSHPKITRMLLIPLAMLTGLFTATGWKYFFMAPATACFISFILIVISIRKLTTNEVETGSR